MSVSRSLERQGDRHLVRVTSVAPPGLDRGGDAGDRLLVGPPVGLGDDVDEHGQRAHLGRHAPGLHHALGRRFGLAVEAVGDDEPEIRLVGLAGLVLPLAGRQPGQAFEPPPFEFGHAPIEVGVDRLQRLRSGRLVARRSALRDGCPALLRPGWSEHHRDQGEGDPEMPQMFHHGWTILSVQTYRSRGPPAIRTLDPRATRRDRLTSLVVRCLDSGLVGLLFSRRWASSRGAPVRPEARAQRIAGGLPVRWSWRRSR